VSGIFLPGQMVKLVEWQSGAHELVNVPGARLGIEPRVIGWLKPGAVAIVVALERADGRNLYVLGSTGGGWIPGGSVTVA